MITLASSPDCTERYHGQFTGARIHVVGRGTDNETLYLKKNYQDAVKDALTTKRTLDTVAAIDLCHDTMMEFIGA
jgi:hypothetical protein